MSAFIVAAIAMLIVMVPADVTIVRGTAADAVVGYQFITAVAVMILALLAEGFKRPSLFELPVLLAVLLYGSGLVYVRALERWL
ncbi:MAG: monovalent cation/H+ antiporter complex subunit F [Trebonia sp.]|uniref:monovalent cation/H+ antiporter complex subunit F n=1 Tax=Trebonia sp. TaxID=2767075 RepID=UPI003BB0F012